MYFPGDPNIDYKNSIKLNIRGLSFYIRDTYEIRLKIEDKVSMDYFEDCINWVLAMDGPNLPVYDNTWEDGDVKCLWVMSQEIREKAFIDRGKLYKSDIQTFVDGVFTVGLRSSNRVLFKGLVQYYTYEWEWNEKAYYCQDGKNGMEIFRKNCIEDFKEFEKYMEDSLITLADSLKYTFRFTRIV